MCHSISRESATLAASVASAVVAIDDARRSTPLDEAPMRAEKLQMIEHSGSGQGPPEMLRKPNRRGLAAALSKPA